MKLAVTSKGVDLDSTIDQRFGRAAYILIVDSETLSFEALDNQSNANAFKGAGIQAATMVSQKGAEILLTGFCGPNAFKALKAGKVKVISEVHGTVRDAVKSFVEGKYSFTDSANVEGHW